MRIDGQAHRRRVSITLSVINRIGEAVGAIIVRIRRIGDSAIIIDGNGAVRWFGNRPDINVIAVQIRIVGQDIDHSGGVFVKGSGIIGCIGTRVNADAGGNLRTGRIVVAGFGRSRGNR